VAQPGDEVAGAAAFAQAERRRARVDAAHDSVLIRGARVVDAGANIPARPWLGRSGFPFASEHIISVWSAFLSLCRGSSVMPLQGSNRLLYQKIQVLTCCHLPMTLELSEAGLLDAPEWGD
jgi:hypothetical protein